jgi:hypothetical protein
VNKTDKQLIRKLIVVVEMLLEETKRDYLRDATIQLIKRIEKRLDD